MRSEPVCESGLAANDDDDVVCRSTDGLTVVIVIATDKDQRLRSKMMGRQTVRSLGWPASVSNYPVDSWRLPAALSCFLLN